MGEPKSLPLSEKDSCWNMQKLYLLQADPVLCLLFYVTLCRTVSRCIALFEADEAHIWR